MLDPTRFFYYLFGLITLAGGIQGFVAKGSIPSLAAGGVCGILLIVGGYFLQTGKITAGLVIGLIVTLALAGQFLPKFFREGHHWWPAGIEGWLGLVGVILTIAAFVKK
jgi:uncharacterized membrane protein (UPF0136 family)